MQNLLKTYQKRLTNLNSRNKSLLLMRKSKNYFFDFQELDFSVNKSAYDLLGAVLFHKKEVPVASVVDARDEKANELSKNLLQLFRSDQLIQAERGAKDLQIGFPFVTGTLNNGNKVRCPLLFFPVKLQKTGKVWTLEVRGDIQLNTSFLLAFQQFNAVKLEESLFETDFEDTAKDLDEFILYLYNYLKESGLELNFNRELFEKRIEQFENLTKPELEDLPIGELKLYPQAVLGIFPQSGSYLAQDYDILIRESEELNFEEQFSQLSSYKVKEKDLHLPLAVDASQEAVLKAIHEGKSMVVQGPPGSGKSQLIANLMADYAAKGKKVLLVCQKRTAIDTVYERLLTIGMAPFAALVHDFKSDRKSLYAQIESQITATDQYKKDNLGLDAIFLEREFAKVSLDIEKLEKELDGFKEALFDDKLIGVSAKELYLRLSEERLVKEGLPIIEESNGINDYQALEKFLPKVTKMAAYSSILQGESSDFWAKRKNTAAFDSEDFEKLKGFLKAIGKEKNALQEWNLLTEQELSDAKTLTNELADFIANANRPESLFHPDTETDINELDRSLQVFEKRQQSFLALSGSNYIALRAALNKALSLTGNTLKLAWFKASSKEWKLLKPWLQNDSLETLDKLFLDFEQLEKLQNKYDFRTVEKGKEVCNDQKRAIELNARIQAKGILSHDVYEYFSKSVGIGNQLQEQARTYFTSFSFRDFYDLGCEQVLNYLNDNEDNLQAYDELELSLSNAEGQFTSQTLNVNLLEKSILSSFVAKIETKYPILKAVSSLKLEQMESEIQALILKKRELSQQNLLIQLKESTYRFIDKNRLGNPTTYRELKHQVSKRRSIWPVRKTLAAFNEELFNLIPCWMASPETVSAIFPMEKYFDLVIFDEASQCYAEHGIPAMMRGKQLMVAGDRMQLQPTDLYNIRYEAVEEGNYRTEIDSLLELAQTFLPNYMLQGHYRSKTLPLIAFSNEHFYNGKLQLIPDFKEVNSATIPISYENVKGTWEANQNKEEAMRVASLVHELQGTKADKTIGVVTFNHPQAKLIRDLVPSDKVAIKNIENIQGDEYDILVFSIGYAPDVNGKIRFQFGSLSNAGGENRLNVAITRAKERIYIIASIEPEELQVELTSNIGPKLLKAYLSYSKEVSVGKRPSASLAGKQTDSFFSLAKKLNAENDKWSTELPYVDLVQKEAEVFSEALLTDDNLFYQTLSSKEAFAYVPLTLKAKSWTFTRKWSRNYWKEQSSD